MRVKQRNLLVNSKCSTRGEKMTNDLCIKENKVMREGEKQRKNSICFFFLFVKQNTPIER